ncbi:hypothetical protein G6F56_009161 [Rhizopus delemar]|nr:hypothetical protein G6F56_009161 [Rhizopus delemar]
MYYSILLFITIIHALELGQTCDPTPHYKPGTFEYNDSCKNIYLFCDSTTRTCNYKGCSNSDYIKKWDITLRPIPTRCDNTSYCPDDNSQCTPRVSVGSHCELVYNTFQQTIVRDNCTEGTYCLESTCVISKDLNSVCSQDRECLSGTCSNEGFCIQGPDVFRVIKAWLWGILGACIVIFILLVLGLLWILHRYQSRQEHAKIDKFFGDNDDFTKYAMLDEDDSSMVYLKTPDYLQSQALSTSHKNPSSSNLHRMQ